MSCGVDGSISVPIGQTIASLIECSAAVISAGPSTDGYLQEDGTSFFLLEDGSTFITLE